MKSSGLGGVLAFSALKDQSQNCGPEIVPLSFPETLAHQCNEFGFLAATDE